MYVCGFPCQPFSSLHAINYQKDPNTKDKRKNMVNHCYDVIKIKQPCCFVLENVPKLVTEDGGRKFKSILKKLSTLGPYEINHAILNTADFDVPQMRKRLYIVGIRKDTLKKSFEFPTPIPQTKTLEDFLVDKKRYPLRKETMSVRLQERLPADHNRKIYAIKWRAGEGTCINMTPCITTSTDIYVTKYNRNLTPWEKLYLQGFPRTFKNAVSEAQLQKQAGNAMSVNVLEALFKEIFKAWGVKMKK